MKVTANYAKFSEHKEYLNRRQCWKKCYGCGRAWDQSDTLHMVIDAEQAAGNRIKYAGDCCLEDFINQTQ